MPVDVRDGTRLVRQCYTHLLGVTMLHYSRG